MKYSASGQGRSKYITSGTGTDYGNVTAICKNFEIPEAYRTSGITLQGWVQSERSSSVITDHQAELYISYTSDETGNLLCGCDAGNNGFGSGTGSLTVDCTGHTYLHLRTWGYVAVTYQGSGSGTQGGYQTISLYIIAPWGIETETFITAAKVNEIASALGLSSSVSATAGNTIIRSPYQTLASNQGLSMNTTKPLASDLQALVAAAGANISGTWLT